MGMGFFNPVKSTLPISFFVLWSYILFSKHTSKTTNYLPRKCVFLGGKGEVISSSTLLRKWSLEEWYTCVFLFFFLVGLGKQWFLSNLCILGIHILILFRVLGANVAWRWLGNEAKDVEKTAGSIENSLSREGSFPLFVFQPSFRLKTRFFLRKKNFIPAFFTLIFWM